MADRLTDLKKIYADPDFRQLAGVEKIKVLDAVDPDFAGLPIAEKTTAMQQLLYQVPAEERGSFWGTLGRDVAGMAGTFVKGITHPIEHYTKDVPAMAMQQVEQAKKAKQAAEQGRYVEAGGYGLAAALPFAGPFAAQIGEEAGERRWGPAGAHALEVFGPEIASGGLSLTGGAATRALSSRLSPVQAARLSSLEARARAAGFPGRVTTPGEARGIRPLEKIERTMQHTPGAAGPAEEFYTARAGELERQARESVTAISPATPVGVAPADIAMNVYGEAGQTIRRTKRAADVIYDEVRAGAARDTQNIRIGTKVEVLPDGSKVYHRIMGTYEAPVPLKPLRTGLQPLYNEFRTAFKDLQESEKMANPGYASIHRIMHDVDPLTGGLRQYMGAMDLESELGAIKEQLRDRRFSSFLFSKSGRAQLQIINQGERLVERALDRATPGLYARLEQGKALVREYKSADRLLTRLIGKPDNLEPMKLYNAMTAAKDTKINAVTRLAQIAPNTSKAVARTVLEGLLEDATKATGRLEGGAGAGLVRGFDRLGPKTKQIWYGSQLARELSDAFQNIKTLMPAEGSPTAWRLPVLATLGVVAEALQSLFMGHPLAALATTAEAGATMTGMNILSRVLFRPGGGTVLTRLVRAARIGGPLLREATRAFAARVAVAEQEQRQEQRQRERTAGAVPTPAAPPEAGRGGRPAEFVPGGGKGAPTAEAARTAPTPAASAVPPESGPSPFGPPLSTPRVSAAADLLPARGTTPPPGTGWEYWGLKPPGASPELGPGRFAPEAPKRVVPLPRVPAAGAAPAQPAAASEVQRRFPSWDRTARFLPDFQRIGEANGVLPAMLRTIAFLESSGDPNPQHSGKEVGLMQLMPDTARRLGVTDRKDPQQSIRGAAKLLHHLWTKYGGDKAAVLAAYNEGEPAFDRHRRRGEPLPEVTRRYVQNGLYLLEGKGRPSWQLQAANR